jgi:uncharacterized protein YndB with AHSA1/START domain
VSRLEREIEIAAPPERVYDVVCDPRCLDEWVTIQESLEEAPDGDLERGSRLVQKLKVAGQRFTVTWTVREAKRPSRIVWEGKGPLGTAASAVYELAPNGGGTIFSYLNEYKLPGGPLGAAVGRALRRAGGREADRTLERLKSFIEKG